MNSIIQILGVLYAALGLLFTINPNTFKSYVSFWKKEKRIYAGGITAIAVGVFFLVLSQHATLPWVLITLGVLGIIKGVFLFATGPARILQVLKWYEQRSPRFIRLMGLLVILIGLLISYSA